MAGEETGYHIPKLSAKEFQGRLGVTPGPGKLSQASVTRKEDSLMLRL
jgi:hypothetical protein